MFTMPIGKLICMNLYNNIIVMFTMCVCLLCYFMIYAMYVFQYNLCLSVWATGRGH